MINTPMDILTQFPIRKSKKQKMPFREAVKDYVESLGYTYTEEKCSFGGSNLVIGDPETAKFVVAAHYDTCARLPFPNLITPRNLPLFIAYQLFQVVFILGMGAVAVGIGVLTGLLLDSPDLGGGISALCYWALLLMLFIGPANKHNANDNTSGIITVLETARTLQEHYRDQVCFVLFDYEEIGLVGSAAYRKAHKKASENQIILNLDCVGDGNEILLLPTKKLKKDLQKMAWLKRCGGWFGNKHIDLVEKGFSVYPSDQANFPYGVGIAAFNKTKKGVLYLSRIHTPKDTILEETNVNLLRACISTLISTAAK